MLSILSLLQYAFPRCLQPRSVKVLSTYLQQMYKDILLTNAATLPSQGVRNLYPQCCSCLIVVHRLLRPILVRLLKLARLKAKHPFSPMLFESAFYNYYAIPNLVLWLFLAPFGSFQVPSESGRRWHLRCVRFLNRSATTKTVDMPYLLPIDYLL